MTELLQLISEKAYKLGQLIEYNQLTSGQIALKLLDLQNMIHQAIDELTTNLHLYPPTDNQ
jgi:hypothetical protein